MDIGPGINIGSKITYSSGISVDYLVVAGGGGGGYYDSITPLGGNGGSGVVIMRYPESYAAASATTGSLTITVAGGYRTYKFTGSGSITL